MASIMTEEHDRKLPGAPDQDESAHEQHPAAPSTKDAAGGDTEGDTDSAAGDEMGDPATDDLDDAADDLGSEDSDNAAGDDAEREPRRAEFLEDLPDAPELQPLIDAFAEGNYARLRSLERELRSTTSDPELLALARELVERTEPDPLAKKLLGLSILFFLLIVGWVYLHNAH